MLHASVAASLVVQTISLAHWGRNKTLQPLKYRGKLRLYWRYSMREFDFVAPPTLILYLMLIWIWPPRTSCLSMRFSRVNSARRWYKLEGKVRAIRAVMWTYENSTPNKY